MKYYSDIQFYLVPYFQLTCSSIPNLGKGMTQKRALEEALSDYNNIVHCDSSNGYVPVEEESVLSGNVARASSKGFTLFKTPYVSYFFSE